MTLERDPQTGAHTFKPPIAPYISPTDAFGRTAAPGAPVTRPIGPVHMTPPQVVKEHGIEGYEVVAFQVELYDARGTWQQEGPYSESHANFADNEMVSDGPNIMRHPFKLVEQDSVVNEWFPAAGTAADMYRTSWAYWSGVLFASGMSDWSAGAGSKIWKETTTTNPAMTLVTTYTPTVGHSSITAMVPITTAGATTLWVCYININGGAGMGIDSFAATTLATPVKVDPSSGHTGTFPNGGVTGLIQAPNGNILLCTGLGDLRICTNITAALAALSFTTVQTAALGYFPIAIGNVALSNYSPGALFWCASDTTSTGLYFANNNLGSDNTPRGRLVLTSYDGLQLDPIDFPDLPYVSFATIYRGGIVACDRNAHYWYTGKAMVSMDGGSDRPADSHKTRLCCGHAVIGDKFIRIENEIDDRFSTLAPNSDYYTKQRVIEYDPYLGRERPISKAQALDFGGGSLTIGAMPSFPFSPATRNLHWADISEAYRFAGTSVHGQDFGRWWRQYQAKNNGKGYSDRSTDADASGGPAGFEGFDDAPTYTSTTFTHPSLQGFEYTPVRAIFSRVESLLAGGDDAYVDITVGGYTGTVSAAEPNDRYPYCAFGEWPNRTWSTALQVELTSHYGTGATHKTPNVWPLTLEVIARRPIQDGIKLA